MNKTSIVLLVITFAATLFLGSCCDKLEQTGIISSKDSLPDLYAEDVESEITTNTKLRAKLFAPELHRFAKARQSYTLFPVGIKVISYDTTKTPESSLKADYAKYIDGKELWEYKGNVEVVNTQGDTLRTQQLFADDSEGILYTKKEVALTFANGSTITGAGGFESNVDFTEFEFKDVSGRQMIDDGEKK